MKKEELKEYIKEDLAEANSQKSYWEGRKDSLQDILIVLKNWVTEPNITNSTPAKPATTISGRKPLKSLKSKKDSETGGRINEEV